MPWLIVNPRLTNKPTFKIIKTKKKKSSIRRDLDQILDIIDNEDSRTEYKKRESLS